MQETIEILRKEWRFLNDGFQSAGHYYHSFIFSTIRNNFPELRTVILRSVDENSSSIHFHSDIRSKKIGDIEKTIRLVLFSTIVADVYNFEFKAYPLLNQILTRPKKFVNQ